MGTLIEVTGPITSFPSTEPWMNVRKKPVIVHAMQMQEPFTTQTLEGEVKNGKPGDYLMVGVRGEVYPCRKDIFEETYDVIAPTNPCKYLFDGGGFGPVRCGQGPAHDSHVDPENPGIHRYEG